MAKPTPSDMRAFGASDEACYRWPEDTDEHKALRAAFIAGAAASAPDLNSICSDLYRLTLVVESAVRSADPGNHSEVLALLQRNQDAFKKRPGS